MSDKLQKLLFLDRDGTIIVDKHYMHDPKEIEFLPHALKALKLFMEQDYKLYVVTNQSGIGRGMFQEAQMHEVHKKMDELMLSEGIKIEEYLFCPHSPDDNCDCRKPSPKLLNQVLNKYQYDPQNSYMIGDKISDVKAGTNAQIKGVLLKSSPEADHEFTDLMSFYNSLKH